MARVEVPITPSVLKWAIDQSGYTLPGVSEAIGGREDLRRLFVPPEGGEDLKPDAATAPDLQNAPPAQLTRVAQ